MELGAGQEAGRGLRPNHHLCMSFRCDPASLGRDAEEAPAAPIVFLGLNFRPAEACLVLWGGSISGISGPWGCSWTTCPKGFAAGPCKEILERLVRVLRATTGLQCAWQGKELEFRLGKEKMKRGDGVFMPQSVFAAGRGLPGLGVCIEVCMRTHLGHCPQCPTSFCALLLGCPPY